MFEQMPDWAKDVSGGGATATLWAAVGRMMYHARQVQQGRRRVFSPALVWELPVALGMGAVGAGLAQWLGLTGQMRDGLVVCAAYIGPRMIEQAFERLVAFLDRKAKKS